MRRLFEAGLAAAVWTAVFALGAALATGALAASSPTVVTGKATSVGQNSAVLNGTVNPNGSSTTYFFQWGLTNAYGVNGKGHSAGSGTKAVAARDTATNLIPGTTYHYRLVAISRFGTTVGSDRTFKTTGHPPPDVVTGPATGIGQNSATLTGVVNPENQQTSWSFQLGSTTSYGLTAGGGTLAASGTAATVSAPLNLTLNPGTIYHYRLVAAHGTSNATSVGNDATFMTFPRHRPVPIVQAGTVPHRLRHRPFSVLTLGRLRRLSFIPAQFGCTGDVAIRFVRGNHVVATTFAAVQPNCTFGGTTTFAHRHRPLSVRVRFLGNGYLAPNQAARSQVVFT